MTRILAIVMFACTLIASPSAADPICLRVPILGNVSASVTQSVDPAASLLFEAGYISLHDEHVLSLWPSWIKANWIEDRLIGRAAVRVVLLVRDHASGGVELQCHGAEMIAVLKAHEL